MHGQLGLALEDTRPDPTVIAPETARAALDQLLAQVRALRTAAQDERTLAFARLVHPQMARWLPDDEAAAVRAAFATELARLGVADGAG